MKHSVVQITYQFLMDGPVAQEVRLQTSLKLEKNPVFFGVCEVISFLILWFMPSNGSGQFCLIRIAK